MAALAALFPVGSAGATGASSGREPAGAALSEVQPTQLTATVTPAVVIYPGAAVIAGSVSVPGAALELSARPAGTTAWVRTATAISGPAGAFRFELARSASTDLRIDFAGDAQHAPASLEVRLGVSPRVTTAFPRGLWLGASVTLRGSVAPAHPGVAVTIERRVEGAWQPLTTATLDQRSRFAVVWRPDEYGFFRLRARIAAGEGNEEGVSASERVTVDRPNRHGVPYRFAHYIVIVVHQYRLYYYEHGALVRAFAVALGRPGYRTPLGHFRIWAKRRPAAGALGACAMYYRGSIAIHGTNEPHLLTRFPRAFSHGCARMYNREVLWLYRRCPRGTPVHNLR